MKNASIILAFLAFCIPAAFGQEAPKPAATTCGKTADECQKVVDTLNDQISDLRLAYQAARQQRINSQTSQSDAEITALLQQQSNQRQQQRTAKKEPDKK